MAKTIRVSDEFHAYVKAHKRDEETMAETLDDAVLTRNTADFRKLGVTVETY